MLFNFSDSAIEFTACRSGVTAAAEVGANKKTGPFFRSLFLYTLLSVAVSGEALAAVDGTIALGDEGHGSGLAASSAGRLEHLAGSGSAVRLTGGAALAAAGGLVLEALLSVEFLLASGEHELSAAVAANQRLVFVHDGILCSNMNRASG